MCHSMIAKAFAPKLGVKSFAIMITHKAWN